MSDGEARTAATRALGAVIRTNELHREARSFRWLDDARQDICHTARAMRRAPAFTAVVVLTISLGIGATTAIFSVVNAVLLKPLPYHDSDRLVRLIERLPPSEAPRAAGPSTLMGADSYLRWREHTRALSHVGVYGFAPPSVLVTGAGAVQASRATVSPSVFRMLDVTPVIGRLFLESDGQPASPAVVLSTPAWKRHFGSSPGVVNSVVQIDGRDHVVVGVLPAGVRFPSQVDLWTPSVVRPPPPGRRSFVNVIARLRDGASLQQAKAEAELLGPGGRFEVRSMKEVLVAPVRPALRVLTISVVFVLLIVCANVANLMSARSTARRQEIAVRLAIGAGRGRIVRQVVTESVMLAVAGGAAGVVLAYGSVYLLESLASVDTPELFQLAARMQFGGTVLPRLDEVKVDGVVLIAALAVSLLTGAVFGIAPAFQLSRIAASPSLVGRGSFPGGSPERGAPVRIVLTLAQVSLATTLLVGASLLARSFVSLSHVDTGYDADGVLTFQLTIPPQYAAARKVAIAEAFLRRVEKHPGVVAAGITNIPPLLGAAEYAGLVVPPGKSVPEMLADPVRPQTRAVSAGYLRAIAARLTEGRWLENDDDEGRPRAVLVNRSFVRRYLGRERPVGVALHVQRGPAASGPWEIVGVIDDVRQARLDEEPYPIVFMHTRQMLAAFGGSGNPAGFLSVAVRVSSSDAGVLSSARTAVKAVDPQSGIDSVATMNQLIDGATVRPRFYAAVMGVFALLATVVAAVGIYGVLSYAVNQRRREIGIRMALGARAAAVLRLVLLQATAWSFIGILAGLAGGLALSRSLAGLLYEISPMDLATYGAVALAVALVSVTASYVPARRATDVDPAMVLRCE